MRPLFGRRDSTALVGVVHLAALPGAPRHAVDVSDPPMGARDPGGRAIERILERAERDARALAEGGCDALVVENFGDVPFFAGAVPPETVAAMSLAVARVRSVAGVLPVGVNVLRNDARAALGICAATGGAFVRVNVHTGAAVTDQGVVEGRAAETLRERARLCPGVRVLADVHVKHASPLGTESIEAAARDAFERGLADALIVTGGATGMAPTPERLGRVREAVRAPILIGSGLTADSVPELAPFVDGAIVGTWLKEDGCVERPVDPGRVRRLRRALDQLGGPA